MHLRTSRHNRGGQRLLCCLSGRCVGNTHWGNYETVSTCADPGLPCCRPYRLHLLITSFVGWKHAHGITGAVHTCPVNYADDSRGKVPVPGCTGPPMCSRGIKRSSPFWTSTTLPWTTASATPRTHSSYSAPDSPTGNRQPQGSAKPVTGGEVPLSALPAMPGETLAMHPAPHPRRHGALNVEPRYRPRLTARAKSS